MADVSAINMLKARAKVTSGVNPSALLTRVQTYLLAPEHQAYGLSATLIIFPIFEPFYTTKEEVGTGLGWRSRRESLKVIAAEYASGAA